MPTSKCEFLFLHLVRKFTFLDLERKGIEVVVMGLRTATDDASNRLADSIAVLWVFFPVQMRR